jgi:hypothetical protein
MHDALDLMQDDLALSLIALARLHAKALIDLRYAADRVGTPTHV